MLLYLHRYNSGYCICADTENILTDISMLGHMISMSCLIFLILYPHFVNLYTNPDLRYIQ